MQTSATWARKSSNPSIPLGHIPTAAQWASAPPPLAPCFANRRARASGHRYRCLRFFCRRRLWFCRRFLLRLRRLRLDRLRTLLRGPSLRHSFLSARIALLRLCALRLRGLNLRRSFYLRGSRILRLCALRLLRLGTAPTALSGRMGFSLPVQPLHLPEPTRALSRPLPPCGDAFATVSLRSLTAPFRILHGLRRRRTLSGGLLRSFPISPHPLAPIRRRFHPRFRPRRSGSGILGLHCGRLARPRGGCFPRDCPLGVASRSRRIGSGRVARRLADGFALCGWPFATLERL